MIQQFEDGLEGYEKISRHLVSADAAAAIVAEPMRSSRPTRSARVSRRRSQTHRRGHGPVVQAVPHLQPCLNLVPPGDRARLDRRRQPIGEVEPKRRPVLTFRPVERHRLAPDAVRVPQRSLAHVRTRPRPLVRHDSRQRQASSSCGASRPGWRCTRPAAWPPPWMSTSVSSMWNRRASNRAIIRSGIGDDSSRWPAASLPATDTWLTSVGRRCRCGTVRTTYPIAHFSPWALGAAVSGSSSANSPRRSRRPPQAAWPPCPPGRPQLGAAPGWWRHRPRSALARCRPRGSVSARRSRQRPTRCPTYRSSDHDWCRNRIPARSSAAVGYGQRPRTGGLRPGVRSLGAGQHDVAQAVRRCVGRAAGGSAPQRQHHGGEHERARPHDLGERRHCSQSRRAAHQHRVRWT